MSSIATQPAKSNNKVRFDFSPHPEAGPAVEVQLIHADHCPRLWRAYPEGADTRYRDYHIGELTEEHRAAGIRTETWCTLASINDQVVGGMRLHRTAPEALPLFDELAQFDLSALRQRVEERAPEGTVHCGGLWVARAFRGYPNLTADIACSHLALVHMLGARWSLGSTAQHLTDAWASIGYFPDPDLPVYPYPDERYQTQVVWCDATRLDENQPGLGQWAAQQVEGVPLRKSGVLTTLRPFRVVS